MCVSPTVSHLAGTKYRLKTTPILPLGFSPLAAASCVHLSLLQIEGQKPRRRALMAAPSPASLQPLSPRGPLDPLSAALPIDRVLCHPRACHEFFIKSPVVFGKRTIRSTINNVPRGGIHRAQPGPRRDCLPVCSGRRQEASPECTLGGPTLGTEQVQLLRERQPHPWLLEPAPGSPGQPQED